MSVISSGQAGYIEEPLLKVVEVSVCRTNAVDLWGGEPDEVIVDIDLREDEESEHIQSFFLRLMPADARKLGAALLEIAQDREAPGEQATLL